MQIATLVGVIDRRILVNYRVEPQRLQRLLPAPFRPKLVRGMGIAGICLIRLKQLRPRAVPAMLGLISENAAHRIAVEWDDHGAYREGVYIPRRDSSSRFITLVGGELFPGIHEHAHFEVAEIADAFSVELTSDDGETHVAVEGHIASHLPQSSIFASLEEASAFFERGACGYSATRDPGRLDSLELCCTGWKVEPLAVTHVQSSFFDDPRRFSPGAATFDCALVMRAIAHEWHVREPLRAVERVAGA